MMLFVPNAFVAISTPAHKAKGHEKTAEYEARPSVLRSDEAKATMRGLFDISVE